MTIRRGASFFDSATSFGMIRGGKVDAAILGAMQVSSRGDIANWMIPGKMVKGHGRGDGPGPRRQEGHRPHGAQRQDGSFKIVDECDLPLTGERVVQRIITDLAVIDVTDDGLVLREVAPRVTVEEVVARPSRPSLSRCSRQPAGQGRIGLSAFQPMPIWRGSCQEPSAYPA